MKLEVKMKKEARLIRRMSGRWREIKFNRKRITVYSKDKYEGWLRKCDFLNLCKVTNMVRTRVDGKYRVKFNPIIFEKTVRLRPRTPLAEAERRTVKVITYTKSQRKFVAREFRKRKIPLEVDQRRRDVTDMLNKFKMRGISTTSYKPSP